MTPKELASGVEGLIEEGEAFRRLGAPAASARARPARGARVFHIGMSVAFLVTVFAGFAPTYFLRGLSDRPPLSPLLHVHGLAFTSWLLLLFTQSALVAGHRVDWHRRLGVAGAMLAAVMVPLGVMTALAGARHGLAPGGSQSLAFLIFPLGQIVMFAGFIGAALWNRTEPEIHRRLVLLATVTLLPPAISRLPFVGHPMLALLLSALFVVAAMLHDWRSRGRIHTLYVWGGLVILLSGPVRFAIGRTGAWQSFARLIVE